MAQRYTVEPRRTPGFPWSVVDGSTGLIVYNSKKRRDCDSWASIWNDPAAASRPPTGNQGRPQDASVGMGGESQ